LVNSTISGNSTGSLSPGGGIYADRGPVTVAHSTITDNDAAGVGGGIALPTLSTLLLTIRHSIVAGNTDGGGAPDLLGTGGLIPSEAIRYSLIGDNSGTALQESQAQDLDTGNIVGDPDGDGVIDPGLGPLSDNGGPTQTHPLLAESLALDAGDTEFDPDAFSPPLNHDQRGDGFERVVGERIDLGAFESTLGLLIDFGDAPTSYPVTLGDDGARHILSELFLGADVDAETDGQPSPAADGDGDDEDGLVMIADAVAVAGTETIASWLVEASGAGKLDAWIDFNGDGDWDDAGEQVHSSVDVVAGPNLLPFTVPEGATPGVTVARLRISSGGGLGPIGLAPDGEVEDHPLLILDGSSAPDALVTLIDPQSKIAAASDAIVIHQGGVEVFRVPSQSLGSLAILGTDSDQVVDIDLSGLGLPVNGLEIDGGGGENRILISGDGEQVDLTQTAIGLSRFGRLDLSSPDANPLVIDVLAVARMSPSSGIIEIMAGGEDRITVTDAADWRMGEPIIENGTFVLTAGHTGVGGESIRALLPSGWRNFLRPADVNNDGQVSAGDALSVINELSRRAFSDPDTEALNDPLGVAVWPNRYWDHNGDNSVTALDALRVINDLARALANGGAGEGEPTLLADVAQAGSVESESVVSPNAMSPNAMSPNAMYPNAMYPIESTESNWDSSRSPALSAGALGPIGRSTVQMKVQTGVQTGVRAVVSARASDYAAAVDELLSDEAKLDLLASVAR
jgi:hypothetical protein